MHFRRSFYFVNPAGSGAIFDFYSIEKNLLLKAGVLLLKTKAMVWKNNIILGQKEMELIVHENESSL